MALYRALPYLCSISGRRRRQGRDPSSYFCGGAGICFTATLSVDFEACPSVFEYTSVSNMLIMMFSPEASTWSAAAVTDIVCPSVSRQAQIDFFNEVILQIRDSAFTSLSLPHFVCLIRFALFALVSAPSFLSSIHSVIGCLECIVYIKLNGSLIVSSILPLSCFVCHYHSVSVLCIVLKR